MRRSLLFVLMVVLVLRGLAGTAMAAGILQPLPPAGAPETVVHAPGATSATRHALPPSHEGHPARALRPAHEHPAGLLHVDRAPDATALDSWASDGCQAGCGVHEEHHSATCSACEICHSAMLDFPAQRMPDQRPASFLRPSAVARFDSAPEAPALKPPIA